MAKATKIKLRSVYDQTFIYSGIRVSPGEEFTVQVTPSMTARSQDAKFMANHLVNERGWCEYVTKEGDQDDG